MNSVSAFDSFLELGFNFGIGCMYIRQKHGYVVIIYLEE